MNIFKCDFPKVAFLQLVDMISRKVIDQLTKVMYQNLWKTRRYRLTRAFWIFSISRSFTAVLYLENIEIFFFLFDNYFLKFSHFANSLCQTIAKGIKKLNQYQKRGHKVEDPLNIYVENFKRVFLKTTFSNMSREIIDQLTLERSTGVPRHPSQSSRYAPD